MVLWEFPPLEQPEAARWRSRADRPRGCGGPHVSPPTSHYEQGVWTAPSQDPETDFLLLRTCACQGTSYELWQSGCSRFIRRVRMEGRATVTEESPRWDGGVAMAQWTAVLMGHLR